MNNNHKIEIYLEDVKNQYVIEKLKNYLTKESWNWKENKSERAKLTEEEHERIEEKLIDLEINEKLEYLQDYIARKEGYDKIKSGFVRCIPEEVNSDEIIVKIEKGKEGDKESYITEEIMVDRKTLQYLKHR